MSKFAGYRRQVFNFIAAYAKLAKVIAQITSAKKIFIVPALGFVGVASFMGVFTLVSKFVTYVESESPGRLASLLFPEEKTHALVVLSVYITVLLLAAAASTYFSALLSRQIGRQTHEHLMQEAVLGLRNLQYVSAQKCNLDQAILFKNFTRNPMQSGIAAESLIALMPAIVYICGAISALLITDPWVSVGLFGIGFLLLPGIYLVSRHILRNAATFYGHSVRQRAKAIRKLLNFFDGTTLRNPNVETASDLIGSEAMQAYLNGLDVNRLASPKMTVVISTFLALAIGGGTALFGWLVLSGERTWETLFIYVGGLLVLMRGFQSFMGQFAALNRLYPQLRTLQNYLQAAQDVDKQRQQSDAAPHQLKIEIVPSIDGSATGLKIDRGTTAVLIRSQPPRRHTIGLLAEAFAKHSKFTPSIIHGAAVASQPVQIDEESSPAEFVLGAGYSVAKLGELRGFLQEFDGESGDSDGLFQRLEMPGSQSSLSQSDLGLLTLAAVKFRTPHNFLFLGQNVLSRLHGNQAAKFLKKPLAPYSFITASFSDGLRNLPEAISVVVMQDDEIVGLGDLVWWRKAREQMRLSDAEASDDLADDEDDF